MARKRRVIGENFGQDIRERSGGLRSQAASHGNVFTGELADEALNAIGARAMTMDDEIIVNSNFNLGSAADQSLYAHELYHKARSGGKAGDKIRDAEEIAARKIESMVFHRAGGGHGDALPDNINDLFEEAEQSLAPAAANPDYDKSSTEKGHEITSDPNAAQGYIALREQGMTHEEIVQMMVKLLLDEDDRQSQNTHNRGGSFKGFAQ